MKVYADRRTSVRELAPALIFLALGMLTWALVFLLSGDPMAGVRATYPLFVGGVLLMTWALRRDRFDGRLLGIAMVTEVLVAVLVGVALYGS